MQKKDNNICNENKVKGTSLFALTEILTLERIKMADYKKWTRVVITTAICAVYLLLTIFYYHIDKCLTGSIFVVLTLLIPIAFLTIVLYTISGIVKVVRNKQKSKFGLFLSIFIALVTLIYSLFSPYRLTSEKLMCEVEIRACYEGTQNQATIKFRQDKSFELHWSGAFGYSEWWTGGWNKRGDTLFLKYADKIDASLGDKVLIVDGYLNPIGKSVNKTKFPRPMFYLGLCRHEN